MIIDSQAQQHQLPNSEISLHLGQRITLEELSQLNEFDRFSADNLRRIIAYPVSSLVNFEFDLGDISLASEVLQDVLRNRVPEFEWLVSNDLQKPIRKYLLIHTSVTAPIDKNTGETMKLEVCAKVIYINGIDLSSPIGQKWYHNNIVDDRKKNQQKWEFMRFRIIAATYSNVEHLGVGVPFYM